MWWSFLGNAEGLVKITRTSTGFSRFSMWKESYFRQCLHYIIIVFFTVIITLQIRNRNNGNTSLSTHLQQIEYSICTSKHQLRTIFSFTCHFGDTSGKIQVYMLVAITEVKYELYCFCKMCMYLKPPG